MDWQRLGAPVRGTSSIAIRTSMQPVDKTAKRARIPTGGIFSKARALWGERIELPLQRARGKLAAQPQRLPTCARQVEPLAKNGRPKKSWRPTPSNKFR